MLLHWVEVLFEQYVHLPNEPNVWTNCGSQIRVSSLCRGRFADLQLARYPQDPPLELLRDVDTRWSSTLLMIQRLLELKDSVVRMVTDNLELRKYALDDDEWNLLEQYAEILKVCGYIAL